MAKPLTKEQRDLLREIVNQQKREAVEFGQFKGRQCKGASLRYKTINNESARCRRRVEPGEDYCSYHKPQHLQEKDGT